MYLEADLKTKERTLKKLRSPKTTGFRYKAPDKVLSFLESV
jgi:hypothetical protein